MHISKNCFPDKGDCQAMWTNFCHRHDFEKKDQGVQQRISRANSLHCGSSASVLGARVEMDEVGLLGGKGLGGSRGQWRIGGG